MNAITKNSQTTPLQNNFTPANTLKQNMGKVWKIASRLLTAIAGAALVVAGIGLTVFSAIMLKELIIGCAGAALIAFAISSIAFSVFLTISGLVVGIKAIGQK